jgi:ABC-type thiamine transport system substrate-binding protein
MAQSYLRLADLAEQNSKPDIVYETPQASSLGKR